MVIKTILLIAMSLSLANDSRGFNPAEKEIIRSTYAEGGILRTLTVAAPADSLRLRAPSHEMERNLLRTDDYRTLKKRMLATVQDTLNPGVGLAAPQIGVLRKLIVVQRFDKLQEPFEFYVNPEIIAYSNEVQCGNEGCLSIPDVSGLVPRSALITLRYRDEESFDYVTEIVSGFTAVIFQHEIDHLNGILFTDRIEEQEPTLQVEPAI